MVRGTEGDDDGDLHEIDVDEDDVEDLPGDDELGLRGEYDWAEEGVVLRLNMLAFELGQCLVELTVQPFEIQVRSYLLVSLRLILHNKVATTQQ